MILCTFGQDYNLELLDKILLKYANFTVGKIIEILMKAYKEK